MTETDCLMSSPPMARRLLESIAAVDAGDVEMHELMDIPDENETAE
ncbi:hypothetical protein [Nocardia sp. NPDC004123]